MKETYIYDLETYKYMFLASFFNIKTKEWIDFEISARCNNLYELKEFLKSVRLIGYNNINFDYPVLHNTILSSKKEYSSIDIYNESQNIIKSKYSAIWDNQIKIPQLDLFKIWHYDNKAISTSLKWLEFAMRLENIQDLPYPVDSLLTNKQMDDIIEYCHNDVEATYQFYLKSLDKIKFRQQMSKELKTNLLNHSDVAIGQLINQKLYEKFSKKSYFDFKKLRTYRESYKIKDLIPDYINYDSEYLNNFLNEISKVEFKENESFERHLNFANIELTFAKGGLHSKDKPLDLQVADDEILEEKDVGSMYPASIINGEFYPKHLGKEWYLGIKYLFEERAFKLKPKLKTLDKNSEEYSFVNSKQEAYKLAMNGGGYGKTGEQYSWQYDPLVIMKTTFKGQLSLIMLIEQLYNVGCEIISANTDGVVVKYKKSIKHIVDKVHSKWENTTKYILENTRYKRIIYRDVNNYIANICDDEGNHIKYKQKGAYEIDRLYHKNHSKRIVAIAAFNKFIYNIEPKETIINHLKGKDYLFAKNHGIYDFCIGSKMKSKNKLYSRIVKNGRDIIDTELSKTNRYYVSNNGVILIKKLPKLENATPTNQLDIFGNIDNGNRESNLEVGYKCTLFNNYIEDSYDINYDYYINETNKLVNIFN